MKENLIRQCPLEILESRHPGFIATVETQLAFPATAGVVVK